MVYETIRVRIEGIHPASRIGIMIFERSKRSRLRFVMKFPNKMPGLAENRLITVNLLLVAGKEELPRKVSRFSNRQCRRITISPNRLALQLRTDKRLLHINTM